MALYLFSNGPMQTTAPFGKVTTGTTIKTMLQIKPLGGIDLHIVEWGFSVDGIAINPPGQVELIETDVAATVTAYVSQDITRLNNPAGPAADTGLVSLGTAASGYTATVEGSITTVRNLDGPIQIPPTGPFEKQISLGKESILQAGKFLRIRNLFISTVNVQCYVIVEPN